MMTFDLKVLWRRMKIPERVDQTEVIPLFGSDLTLIANLITVLLFVH